MAQGHAPFGFTPPGFSPWWFAPGAGGYRLYRGLGGPAGLDFTTPVGFAQADAAVVVTPPGLRHQQGRAYCYCLRRVSDAGVEEHNTHVLCAVRYEAAGIEAILATPSQVRLRRIDVTRLELAWRLAEMPGQAWPDEIEVLRSDGAGGWQPCEPPVSVPVSGESGCVSLSDRPPNLYAVRARRGQQVGPPCPAGSLPPVSDPTVPQLL